MILVSAGFDAHVDDLLGGMALGSDSFGRFAALISDLSREVGAAPPAFILEESYNLDALTESVAATIRGRESPSLGLCGRVEAHSEEPRGPGAVWRSLR